MIRIAKIADEVGGTDAGGKGCGEDGSAACTLSVTLAVGASESRVTGFAAKISVESSAPAVPSIAGGSASSAGEREGFERRRGIGGGWLSGGAGVPAFGKGGSDGCASGMLAGLSVPAA
jgi:hypothetical protein